VDDVGCRCDHSIWRYDEAAATCFAFIADNRDRDGRPSHGSYCLRCGRGWLSLDGVLSTGDRNVGEHQDGY
jgi:hypothetical protein